MSTIQKSSLANREKVGETLSYQEEFVFWRLAYSFIHDHGYRVIQLFQNQKELWLEKLNQKGAPIIRLLCQDLNWGSTMQRDIELVAANGERIRKQVSRGNIHIVNIYSSTYPPVDEYEFRINKPFIFPESSRTSVSTVIMAREEYEGALNKLSDLMGKKVSFPIQGEYVPEEIDKVKNAALQLSAKRVEQERAIYNQGKPFLTYLLMAIQIAVFIFLEFHGGSKSTSTLIKYGAKYNPLILQGEWWRFITPIFLHIGFLHLAMNTLALYYLGTEVERLFGRARFLFIYLIAGFTASIASFLFSPQVSAGASGAIFGCFGALLYLTVIYPKQFFRTIGMNVIVLLVINLVFGFTAPGIDNAGHLGGLAGGFLATGIVHFPKRKKPLLQLLFLVATAAVIWFSLSYGFSGKAAARDENTVFMLAQEYVKKGDYQKAYKELDKLEKESDHPSAKVYFLLSYTEIKQGMLAEAKQHLEKTIRLEPGFHEAYYNLALISLDETDWNKAFEYAKKAAKLNPSNKDYSSLVKQINDHLQSTGGGI